MHFKKHFFAYLVVILLVFLSAASYFRFVVQNDYIVAYEGDCDPYSQECFVYYEEGEPPFYYSIIERHAAEIYSLCGVDDVTMCDEAYECQDDVEICSVIFCDIEFDGEDCELLTEGDYVEDFNEPEL